MLSIVYQDNDLLILDKPAGMLTVPGTFSNVNLLDLAVSQYPNCRLVHRLDMDTSGLVIFALNYRAQKNMNRLFEQRKIRKYYTAVVDNIVTADFGEIHLPLLCDRENRPLQKIDWLNGKPSTTFFTTLQRQRSANTTRLLLEPYTGRSHQLRLHLWQLGHPILGDEFYFNEASQKKSTRLMLHATSLAFNHPISGFNLVVESKPEF